MNTLYKFFSGMMMCVLALLPMACEDEIDPLIEELETERPFAPVGLEARVRNQIELELSWTANGAIDEYIVEIFQDSLQFAGDPIVSDVIDDVPALGTITYTASLAGDPRYSARVKAVPSPTIAGTLSVPERKRRSCPPPCICGIRRTRGSLRLM